MGLDGLQWRLNPPRTFRVLCYAGINGNSRVPQSWVGLLRAAPLADGSAVLLSHLGNCSTRGPGGLVQALVGRLWLSWE